MIRYIILIMALQHLFIETSDDITTSWGVALTYMRRAEINNSSVTGNHCVKGFVSNSNVQVSYFSASAEQNERIYVPNNRVQQVFANTSLNNFLRQLYVALVINAECTIKAEGDVWKFREELVDPYTLRTQIVGRKL